MMSFQVVNYLGSWHQVLLGKGLGGVTSFCDSEAFLELRGELRVGTAKTLNFA